MGRNGLPYPSLCGEEGVECCPLHLATGALLLFLMSVIQCWCHWGIKYCTKLKMHVKETTYSHKSTQICDLVSAWCELSFQSFFGLFYFVIEGPVHVTLESAASKFHFSKPKTNKYF